MPAAELVWCHRKLSGLQQDRAEPQVSRWEGRVPAAAVKSLRGWFAKASQGNSSAMNKMFPLTSTACTSSLADHQPVLPSILKPGIPGIPCSSSCARSKYHWRKCQSPLLLADPQLQEQPQGGCCFYSECNRAISEIQEVIHERSWLNKENNKYWGNLPSSATHVEIKFNQEVQYLVLYN